MKVIFLLLTSFALTWSISLLDAIREQPNHSFFYNATVASNIQEFFASNNNELTVFVPNDEAFAAVDEITIRELFSNSTRLSEFVLGHVVTHKILRSNIRDNEVINTAGPHPIRTNIYERAATRVITINGARAVSVNSGASNGVIYEMDEVLFPEPRTIGEIVEADKELGIVWELFNSSGLLDILHQSSYTLFAPIDKSFTNLSEAIFRSLFDPLNVDIVRRMLLFHLTNDVLFAPGIYNNRAIVTLAGQSVLVRKNGSNFLIDEALANEKDILAANGVIHKTKGVMIPSYDLLAAFRLLGASEFQNLFLSTNLTMDVNESWTVFVPSNSAFANSTNEELSNVTTDMDARLEFVEGFIVPQVLFTSNFTNDVQVETLEGSKLRLNFYNMSSHETLYTVNGVPITYPNINTSYGVVHEIPSLLPHPTQTIYDALDSLGLNILRQAFELVKNQTFPGLLENATLLAPSDRAFHSLSPGVLNSLLQNHRLLTLVLNYHIIPQTYFSVGFTNGSLKTVQGQRIGVEVTNETILFDGRAEIVKNDLIQTNGVIQIIDTILTPDRKRSLDRYYSNSEGVGLKSTLFVGFCVSLFLFALFE